jgi:hypothetical protein
MKALHAPVLPSATVSWRNHIKMEKFRDERFSSSSRIHNALSARGTFKASCSVGRDYASRVMERDAAISSA